MKRDFNPEYWLANLDRLIMTHEGVMGGPMRGQGSPMRGQGSPMRGQGCLIKAV